MKLSIYLACLVATVAQGPSDLRFRESAPGQVEVVAPLNAQQQKMVAPGMLPGAVGESWLRLCIVDAQTGKPGPAMFGAYERFNADLIFRPRLGLEPGRTYRAFFGPEGDPVVTKDYRPALLNDGKPATVVKIYPTADVVPANLLKFTIYFSQPMRGGRDIFSQIEILDADGKVVSDAWLMDEIWDKTGQVLIIYIHPGRIKWGLVLRDVLGPVLYPDRDYTLVIRGALADANGHTLGKDITKKFHTTAEDRVRIDLGEWKLEAPTAGTVAPLLLRFPKSLDHHSLQQFLTVEDSQGKVVAGSPSLGKEEKAWSFTPAHSWESQGYRLVIGGRLEDLAGNTPQRPFDLNLQAPVPPVQRLDMPFRPR